MNKILNQDEVDALLRGMSGGEVETESDMPDDTGIVPFDLANQDRIIRSRMPVMELINDRFARLAGSSITNALRKKVEVNPITIDMARFGDFMRSLPVPASINIFRMDPLRGNALLIVDTRLVFSLVENFFGGSGSQPKVEERDFTPIEQVIIDRIVKILLENMEEAWKPVHEVTFEPVRSEINPQFATIVQPGDIVVVVSFEVELGGSVGSLIVALPYSTIEPIRSKLHATFQSERTEVDPVWTSRLKTRLMETPVEVVVTLGTTRLSCRQLTTLKVGDVLLLDTRIDDLLTVDVEGIRKFAGVPGSVRGGRAFQISREERNGC
jgi:flagellar motor switch protein FliM